MVVLNHYIMDVYKRLELVKIFVNDEIQRLEGLLPLIDSLLTELQEAEYECEGLSAATNGLATTCSSVEDANISLCSEINNISSFLKPTVQWHSNKKEMLEMFYLDGNSPWSVWLTYNPSTEIDGLYKILEQRHAQGLLKKLKNPKVGDFICCYDKKTLFRAVIIDISSTRIKVINVDRYNVKIIKQDACYEITKELSEIHAYSIQCCLTKDTRFEKKWNEDLGRLFQNTLRECRLTVRIVEEISSLPPIFVVEMYAFNEALEVETNITHWITSRLLPELNNLSDDNDHVLNHFSDEALDPFSNLVRSSSEPSCLETNKENELTSFPNNLVVSVSEAVQNISLEDTCTKEKPRNRLAHLISPNGLPNLNVVSNNGTYINNDSNGYLTDNTTNNIDYTCPYSSNTVSYKHESNGIEPKGPSDENITNDIVNGFYDQIVYEDTVIPSNYIPTDEDRICSFYAKKGFCWKPGCTKQHTNIEKDRWTEDTAEFYKDTLNSLSLPSIDAVIVIKVSFVVLCNTFYALLPDSFSDTGDGCETLESLNYSLNSPETKKHLKLVKIPPCLGQLVIAYSSTKSLWLRASVRDVYDNNMLQVYFVDFGMIEELSLDKCREIEPQYLHLPCQAVYCTLANVFVESEDERGKLFIETLILNKNIQVQIVNCDIVNNSIEVIAFHNGVNINQLLIDKGFCLAFRR